MAKRESKANQLAGSLFVASCIIGVAVGLLTEKVAIFGLIGAGVGFIAAALVRYYGKE